MSVDLLNTCLSWCIDNGSVIDDRLEFKYTKADGISCYAKSNIEQQDEPLIYVSKSILFDLQLAEAEFGVKAEEVVVTSKNSNALTQLLLAKFKFDDNCSSPKKLFFGPYIEILPEQMNQPYFWESSALDLIKGTDLLLAIKENIRKIYQEWLELSEQIENFNPSQYELSLKDKDEQSILRYIADFKGKSISWNSFRAYVWATSIFTSRAFPQLLLDEQSCKDANQAFLLPIIDFLNHKNGEKVNWAFNNQKITFKVSKSIPSGGEIYNNYGDKTNEELILNYGFVEDNNVADNARLTMRLDADFLSSAPKYGILLPKSVWIKADCVQFTLAAHKEFPESLIALFGLICKLKSETKLTTRSVLEGLDQLKLILSQKVDFYKNASQFKEQCNNFVSRTIKKFLLSQMRILNVNRDKVDNLQKFYLKSSKSHASFKKIFKSDKIFANSVLLNFGAMDFADVQKKNCMKEVLLLWVVRISNVESYSKKFEFTYPSFIKETFDEVSSKIIIQKDDVTEFLPFYKNMFPKLSERIPEIYGQGDWNIRRFIVADSVVDKLVWTKPTNSEPFFLEDDSVSL